jgi:hypothetical protein
MTDETNILNDEPQEDELTALKARADVIGIKYHPTIGLENLKARIAEHLAEPSSDAAPSSPDSNVTELVPETATQEKIRMKREATALVRLRISCMNPHKREYEGEIFTTGNGVVGTIKRYIPFDTEWHCEQMILNMIQERYCQVFYTSRDPNTKQKTRRAKMIKEFSIEILPALTEAELHDLAQRQAMANGTAA